MIARIVVIIVISFAIAVSWITIANAQQQSFQSEYTLKIKAVDIDKIGRGLVKLSYEEVVDLLQSLRQQIVEQQSKPNQFGVPVPGDENAK